VRTLASGRRRNVDLAQQAVNESRAFTETEALNASPPLIDFLAADVPELVQKINGRSIRRFDGKEVVVDTSGATVVAIEMSLRQRILSAVAHPNIAYLLLSLGMLGLTIEMWSPGAIVPGVVGGVSLLLAFFALQLLPVNYAGLLLIVLGMIFLILEIKVTSYGLLTLGGVASLVFGSMILMDSSVPGIQLSLSVVVPVVVGFVGIGATLVRLAVRAQRQPPATGPSAMIGEAGIALTSIGPEAPGSVSTHGEIWNAVATEAIPEGARVRVTGVDGLMLRVSRG
jgi:membrane-bound serine protease (ClpP class)